MMLRKLIAAVLPPVLCILLGFAFRWLDGLAWLNPFWGFALKGLLLGILLALVLPIGGVKSRMNGLQPWFLGGAGLLVALVLLQYLGYAGVLILPAFLHPGSPLLLAEGAAVGFVLVTVVLNRRR